MIKTIKYTKRKNYPEPVPSLSRKVPIIGRIVCEVKISPAEIKKAYNELKKKFEPEKKYVPKVRKKKTRDA